MSRENCRRIARKHLRQWICSAAQLEIVPEDRAALMEEKEGQLLDELRVEALDEQR